MAPATSGGNPGSRTGRKRSMRARKRVARDFFAALHAFEEEGVARTLGDAQIGADGSQQIRRKNIVDGDEVALLGEALEFSEVRLDHRRLRGFAWRRDSSVRKAPSTALRMADSGARFSVQISH